MVYAKTGIKALWSCPILLDFLFFLPNILSTIVVQFLKIYSNNFCLRSFENQVDWSRGGKLLLLTSRKIQLHRPFPNGK